MTKGKREKTIPWYNDDFGEDFVFEDVVEALTLYKDFYGDFSNLTGNDFVIPVSGDAFSPNPFDDDDDDMSMYDASTRAAAAVARFDDDEEEEPFSEDLIAAELQRMQGEKVMELEMESQTAVATRLEAIAEWPEHLGGMALGHIVRRIRDGSLEVKHLPERKEQLDAIDFDWGDERYFLDVPFELAMCAMYAYYLVRGDMFVREDFVMPDEDPWPTALAGYELGSTVRRIRELQNFMEAYHPEKVELLRGIDFIWFPTLALPLDPNEPEMSDEILVCSGLGHPDYYYVREPPMGVSERTIAEGPYFETEDPKLWWRKWHNWEHVKDAWYAAGSRDHVYMLERLGFPRMAAEHEAKYGPGLYSQINATLQEIPQGDAIYEMQEDEKTPLIETLRFYKGELVGAGDLPRPKLAKLVFDIDTELVRLLTGTRDGATDLAWEETMKSGSQEDALEAALRVWDGEDAVDEEYDDSEEEYYEDEEELNAESFDLGLDEIEYE